MLRVAERPGDPRTFITQRFSDDGIMISELFVLALVACRPALHGVWESLRMQYSQQWIFVVGVAVSQIGGYLLGALPYMVLDFLKPRVMETYKIQTSQYATRRDLFNALLGNLATTFLLILPPLTIGAKHLPLLGINGDAPIPSSQNILLNLAFFLVIEDYLNYWLHRMLHLPWLYKRVHSVHHQYNAPFALAAAYAHPFETFLLSIPTFAGPLLVGPHMFTLLVWQLLRNYEAIDIHSGYELPVSFKPLFPLYAGADHHDYHHYMHSGNFASVFTWCDKLYGTDLGYESFKSKKQKAT